MDNSTLEMIAEITGIALSGLNIMAYVSAADRTVTKEEFEGRFRKTFLLNYLTWFGRQLGHEAKGYLDTNFKSEPWASSRYGPDATEPQNSSCRFK